MKVGPPCGNSFLFFSTRFNLWYAFYLFVFDFPPGTFSSLVRFNRELNGVCIQSKTKPNISIYLSIEETRESINSKRATVQYSRKRGRIGRREREIGREHRNWRMNKLFSQRITPFFQSALPPLSFLLYLYIYIGRKVCRWIILNSNSSQLWRVQKERKHPKKKWRYKANKKKKRRAQTSEK